MYFSETSRRYVRRALALMCAFSAVMTAPAIAGRHTYRQDYALANSHTYVVAGQSDGVGGCSFPGGNVSLAVGHRATEVRELSLDSDTCQATFERGTPPPSASADQGGGDSVSGTQTYPSTPNTRAVKRRAPRARAAAYTRSAGYNKTYWEDPVGIDVNEVKTTADFYYGGGCVHNPVANSYYYHWYTPSGWGLHENNWKNDASCADTYSSSYVHFQNGAFCAGLDVNTWYDRTSTHGHPDGSLVAYWNSYNTGATCRDLLGFHEVLVRTAG